MTAIAPSARTHDEDSRHFAPPVARPSTSDRDRTWLADAAPSSTVVQSPWRDPLFYLSFVAMALLLCAVGILLLFRIVTRGRRR